MSVWVGPTAAAVAHLGYWGVPRALGLSGDGALVPTPTCQRPGGVEGQARWGRVKNNFSRGGGGVGATPVQPITSSEHQGPGGLGRAVRGRAGGSPAGRGRNVLKQQQPKDQSQSRLRTAHRSADPELPSPPPQVLRGKQFLPRAEVTQWEGSSPGTSSCIRDWMSP